MWQQDAQTGRPILTAPVLTPLPKEHCRCLPCVCVAGAVWQLLPAFTPYGCSLLGSGSHPSVAGMPQLKEAFVRHRGLSGACFQVEKQPSVTF